MKLHKDSHVDHGLSQAQLSYVLQRFGDHNKFFISTIELPEDLGTVPCNLMGPIVGDGPVPEPEVTYEVRGDRAWKSRMIETAYPRKSRKVTVIAGPHDGEACVLFTVYGGPLAPKEPGDIRRQLEAVEEERRERRRQGHPAPGDALDTGLPGGSTEDAVERAKVDPLYARLVQLRAERVESDAFWSQHALTQTQTVPG